MGGTKQVGPTVDEYRLNSRFNLRPGYISLGLPRSAFGPTNEQTIEAPFDAVADGGTIFPDCVWAFRGEDRYRINIKVGSIEEGPSPISTWATGGSWPISFNDRIDAAVWGGPTAPTYWYFFKENLCIRGNTAAGGRIDVPPFRIGEGGWTGLAGTPFVGGIDAALHGIGAKYSTMTHLFKGSQYVRYDLLKGVKDFGPVAIAEVWPLPKPFSDGIDFAFYGSGDRESEIIYFFKGEQCIRFSTTSNKAEKVTFIEYLFPQFAQFIPKPQIFLMEDYVLESYVGPIQQGQKVGPTLFVAPGESTSVRMIIESTATSASAIQQSILQSEDEAVTNNFYDEMKKENKSETSSDAYQYQMDASFHGDASANSVWGGEANAQLGVKGSTDEVRSAAGEAASGTVSKQVSETSKQTTQRVQSSTEAYTKTDKTLYEKIQKFDNATTSAFQYEFYQDLEPFVTLLVLTHVRLVFVDPKNKRDVAEIEEMDQFIDKHIVASEMKASRQNVKEWIVTELSRVRDGKHAMRSVLKRTSDKSVYHFDNNLKSTYSIKLSNGAQQTIETTGLIQRADDARLVPLNSMRAIDRSH